MEKLFKAFKLGSLQLPNRIIRASSFENNCYGGVMTQEFIDHHLEFVEGGIGMTTTGTSSVDRGHAFSANMFVMGEDEERYFQDLKMLSDAVHEKGFFQYFNEISNLFNHQEVAHCGMRSLPELCGEPISSSSLPLPSGGWFKENEDFSKEMTLEDIEYIKDRFIRSIVACKNAGIDAVELHCAHGYLLTQFLSPLYNKREDNYGGSNENRARLPVEILEAARKEINDEDYPILVKFNSSDCVPEGTSLADGCEHAKMFEAAGATAIVPSQGLSPEFISGKELFLLDSAKEIAKSVSIPTIYVGGVGSVESIEKVFDAGFELIQIGRAMTRQMDMVNKIRSGEISDEFDCIYCNGCFGWIYDGNPLDCKITASE